MEMKKEDIAAQGRNAEAILARIKEESAQESARVLGIARADEEKILVQAAADAARTKAESLEALAQELEKARERVFSSVALEKKRLLLEEKDRLIKQVLQVVQDQALQFRGTAGYADFLRAAVAEGARVVGGDSLVVTYAPADATLFAPGEFVRSLASLKVAFSYAQGDFDEPGVILTSADGRIRFDNRFSSRLARLEADIYARLLKEAF